MNGKLRLILVVSLGVVLLASSTGVTRSSFVDPGSSTGNDFQAWASTPWVQTTRADFEAGVLNQVDTSSSPGNVKLGIIYGEPTTSVGPEESWYYPSWSRRAPVTINNPGSNLTDYQVKVDVNYDADMQSDFDDIRFVDSDDSTELPHWRESYTVSTSATFWVKVPSIPSGAKTIYMYYGNAAAGSASDGNTTFEFFDNFSGNLSKWSTIAGTWAIDAGRLTTTSGTGRTAIHGTGTSFGNAIIEFKSTAPPTTADHNIGSYHRGDGTVANTNAWLRFYWDTIIEDWKLKDGVTVYANATGDSLEGVWRNQKIVMVGNTQQLYVDGTLKIDYTGASGTNPGKVGVLSYASAYLAGKYWDDYRVRKYASPEPTTSVGSEDGWSRRAPVTINNPGSNLTDYQVKVDVNYDADMQPDFDDIRFVDSDDSTQLSHWREAYTASASATFWVKVPSIPSGGKTIYLYYGNDAASSASDGNATFLFYDDFDDHAAGEVPDGWTMHSGCSGIVVQDDAGNKVLDDGTGSGGNVTAGDPTWTDIACRQRFRSVDNVVSHAGVVIRYTDEGNEVYGGIVSDTTAEIWNRVGGTWTKIGGTWTIPDVGTSWHVQELRIAGDTVELYIDDEYIGSGALTSGAPTSGASGFWCQYSHRGYRDEHIVRKYAPQPVSYTSSGTIASQVLNTGVDGARWDALFWDETLPSNTDITFKVRASDTSFAKDAASPPWTPVGETFPVISGRYMQWRATLTTSDPSQTPTLHEVRVYYSDY